MGAKGVPKASQELPRAAINAQERSRALQEGSRDSQETLKMVFEGFRVEDEIGNQFCTRFGPVFRGPGPSKLRFSCETYCIFCDFAFFNPDPIWDPILDPPGLSFGSALAPKIAETCLEIPLGAPKSRWKDLFSARDGSKGAPRGPREASSLPTQLQELSKRPRDRF